MSDLETKTVIRHGVGAGEVIEIPAGQSFPGKYKSDFTDEEIENLKASGAVGPRAEVDQKLSDVNEALALRVAELESQLVAALSPANQNAGPGSGAAVLKENADSNQKLVEAAEAKADADKKAQEDADAKAAKAAEDAAKQGPKL